MSDISPFRIGGSTVAVSCTTTSADETISGHKGQIVVYNAGTVAVFMRTGIGAQTAVTTDYPVAPGSTQTLSIPTNHNTVGAITGSGTATLYVTPGEGT
jgi:hypothetical protein